MKKNQCQFVGVLCFLFFAVSCISAQSVKNWRQNVSPNTRLLFVSPEVVVHTFFNETKNESVLTVANAVNGKVIWKKTLKESVDQIIADEKYFYAEVFADAGEDESALLSVKTFEKTTGTEKTLLDVRDILQADLVEMKLHRGLLYLAGEEIGVWAINPETGAVSGKFRECFNLNYPDFLNAEKREKKLFFNGEDLFFFCANGVVYRLNSQTLELKGKVPHRASEIYEVVFDEENFYVLARLTAGGIYLDAYRQNNLEFLWLYDPEIMLSSGDDELILNQDKLYLQAKFGGLIAIEKKSGEKLWETDTDTEEIERKIGKNRVEIVSPQIRNLVLRENTLFGYSESGSVYSLNAENGAKNWQLNLTKQRIGEMKVTANAILLTDDDFIYRINPDTGKLVWKIKAEISSRLFTDENDNLTFLAFDRILAGNIALNQKTVGKTSLLPIFPNTAQFKKKRKLDYGVMRLGSGNAKPETVISDFGAAENGKIYYAMTAEKLTRSFIFEIDSTTGKSRPVTMLSATSVTKPKVAGNTLYIGSGQSNYAANNSAVSRLAADTQTPGILYAVDLSSDKILWQVETDSKISFAPQLHHGNIYAVSEKGFLYAVSPSGQTLWKTLITTTQNLSLYADNEPKFAFGTDKIFVSSPMKAFIVLETATGKIAWTKAGTEDFRQSFVLEEKVCVALGQGNFYCFDQSSGVEKDGFLINSEVQKLKTAENLLFIEGVSRITLADKKGKIMWERLLSPFGKAEIIENKVIDVRTGEVFDLKTGERLKKINILSESESDKLIYSDKNIAVLKTAAKKLIAVNLSTEKIIWELKY